VGEMLVNHGPPAMGLNLWSSFFITYFSLWIPFSAKMQSNNNDWPMLGY